MRIYVTLKPASKQEENRLLEIVSKYEFNAEPFGKKRRISMLLDFEPLITQEPNPAPIIKGIEKLIGFLKELYG